MSSIQFPLPNFNDYLIHYRVPIPKVRFALMDIIWELE